MNAAADAALCAFFSENPGLLPAAVYKAKRRMSFPAHWEDDDLLQEAHVAAIKAFRTYNKEKRASLATYVTVCVNNRLKDVFKKEHNQRKYGETIELDAKKHDRGCYDHGLSAAESKIVLERLLEPDSIELIEALVDRGLTFGEIVDNDPRITNKWQRRKKIQELRKCFYHIREILRSKGLSLEFEG